MKNRLRDSAFGIFHHIKLPSNLRSCCDDRHKPSEVDRGLG